MSPLLFVALRMVLAAAILLAIMLLRRKAWGLTSMTWLHCAVAGVLTQAILLMTAHVAMVRSEAAPIALIQTLNPCSAPSCSPGRFWVTGCGRPN